MGSLSPFHLIILSLVALLAVSRFGPIRSWLAGERPPRTLGKPRRGFFHGMNPTTSLALAGALLLSLALLIDVYGPWGPGGLSDNLSLGLAGTGGVLTLLSLILNRRTGDRG
jgi:hypothetical protein